MVSVREYYDKDGKMLPGKKGISLPVDQWAALLGALPAVEGVLRGLGEEVPRPLFGRGVEEGGREAGEAGGKRNFEATSEEDDG